MSYEKKYFIQDSRQYVGNAVYWWCHYGKGYTCDIRLAGIFTDKESENQCDSRDTDKRFLVEDILPLMKPIIDAQDLHRL